MLQCPAVPSCLKVFCTVNWHTFLLGAFLMSLLQCDSFWVSQCSYYCRSDGKYTYDLKHSLSPKLLEVVFENIEWQMASVSNLRCTRLTNDLVNLFAHVAVKNECFIKLFTQLFKEHMKCLHKSSFLCWSSVFHWKRKVVKDIIQIISVI